MRGCLLIFLFWFANTISAQELQLIPELSNRYCVQDISGNPFIRLRTNDPQKPITIRMASGQKILPLDLQKPSVFQNNFTHVVMLADLSRQDIPGAIAFDTLYAGAGAFHGNHAVIFTSDFPKGISSTEFAKRFPQAQHALENFLTLFPVFVAAIDSCRPVRVISYATTEETDRIEGGRRRYFTMTKLFNAGELEAKIPRSNGLDGGFYDPQFRLQTPYGVTLSFEHLNPLNLFEPGTAEASGELSIEECQKIIEGALRRKDAPTEPILRAEYLYRETHGRCKKSASLL